jgi:tetratricopeptide (TPR) repeat protein/predicted Ser/Thr protein kinase
MDAERLRHIEELHHHALGMDKDQRAGYLLQACAGDLALHAEVESLLAYETKASDFIETPAVEVEAQSLARGPSGAPGGPLLDETPGWMPERIGSYRILRQIGEGGMGVVYEAEQDQPRRTVALKVIKPGMTTREVLRRFELEAQALARLQNPAVAQIYEAGTADIGFGPQPYFAMELIRGRTLLEYTDENHLSTRQRLELMVRICEGVHHAHQRGLIHRDLKPGNILVEENGQPKIVDFGVARATDNDMVTTRQTSLGQLVGTLAYMSPEQVRADPLELDTRSDVYALGVILYELLTGRLPYELGRLPLEAARAIWYEDPTPLSSISRLYRGDIETVVAKALEKDKSRRYASASDLGADIQRYLTDQPIAARPASTIYQMRKFARRHRAIVGALAAVFVVLVGGIIASTREAARARRAEEIAVAVNDFLQNDLLAQAAASTQAGPNRKPDPGLTVRTALDRAAASIGGKFGNQPLVEAAIRYTIGNTYEDLGVFTEAQQQMKLALDLRQRELGSEHDDTLDTMGSLATIYWDEGRYPQAELLYKDQLEIRRRVKGKESRETLTAMHNLASVYQNEGKYPEAESLLNQVLQARLRTQGAEDPETLASSRNLASLYLADGNYGQAETAFKKVLEVSRRVLGEEHPSTLRTMGFLATVYWSQGKYTEAETIDKKVVDAFKRVFGEEHIDTLGMMNNLAAVYRALGRYDEAEHLWARVLEISRRVLGAEHPITLGAMGHLAGIDHMQGRDVKAEPLMNTVLELRRRSLGAQHPQTLWAINELALLYHDQHKDAEAEALLTQVLDGQRRSLGGEHPDTLDTMRNLADIYESELKPGEAESLLRQAHALYQKRNDGRWPRYSCESMLGFALERQKKYPDAEPLLLSGFQGIMQRETALADYDRIELKRAGQRIVQLYQDWEKPQQAAEWVARLQAVELSNASAKP